MYAKLSLQEAIMSKKAQKFNLIKDCIAQAMFELLKTKEFKDIKISELTEKAGVSRITYYRNFFDKKDVITYAFERYLRRTRMPKIRSSPSQDTCSR